ncbi:proto-oncogene Mas-like isoform X2 [Sceloporus undulatus]|nr:proto-oncogene Mas-like isoform X2 [Sceloporus undulatus]XP_042333671.1 proto-oncogene Mas-like isoform X2 [Sceloporus undulatus]
MAETNSSSPHPLDALQMNEIQVERDDYSFTILSYIIMPITILGLISNGAIFWFLCCRIKRTKYTVYVLNLAIADFTVLLAFDLVFVFSFIMWSKLVFDGYLYDALDILCIFGYNTSFFMLTAISVERCLGAFCPIRYHFNRPKHLSTILCTLLWVLSCVVTGVEYFTCWSVLTTEVPYRKYPATTIFLAMVFLLFTPVMVLCSVSLFIKIRRNSQAMSQARLYLIIVIAVVLFLLFALPFRIMCLIVYWYSITDIEWTLLHCSSFLHLINSSADPFVYFLVGKWRRRETLYAVLYRSCKDEAEVPVPQHLGNEQEERSKSIVFITQDQKLES